LVLLPSRDVRNRGCEITCSIGTSTATNGRILSQGRHCANAALLAPSGEEYDRFARRSVSLEQVRDRPFVIAVTNFDQPYSFMSAQRAIEAVFLGYSWMSNTQRRK
jgi:hypothetical protein